MQLSPVPPQRQPALVIPQDRPVYRIGSGQFFGPDDCLYPEGSVIAWDEIPNQEMEPLNALAQEKMRAYLAHLDAEGRKVAEKMGKSYTNLGDAYENSISLAKEEGKKVQLIGGKEQVPLMGAKKRGRPSVQKIELEQAAPLMGKGKLSLNNSGRDEVNKSNGGI